MRSVCELCFGDTIIAERCRARGIRWTGVDLNPTFCMKARERGFDVIEGDLFAADLPKADACVMAGSLYHFHHKLETLFETIFSRIGLFILSEPVRNLSLRPGLVGWLARRAANPGNGRAPFRFDAVRLESALRELERSRGYAWKIVSVDRDLVAEIRSGL